MLFKTKTALLPLCIAIALNSAAVLADTLTLKDAAVVALASNPSLAAIQSRADALAAIPSQVETLPDPRLMVNLVNLPLDHPSFTQEGMTQFQVGISQMLPYPGKLALRGEAATQEAKAALFDLDERRLQLKRDVTTVWWNVFYLDKALVINAKNQSLLQQFVTIAETRYQVGQGLQQDVLLAQLELSQLQNRVIALQQLRESESARLNTLLDRPVQQSFMLPDQVDELLVALPTADELHQRALVARPNLEAQAFRIKAAQARIDLAKKDYYPDFKVGAVYGLREGSNPDGSHRSDFASVQFSMNLPIFAETKQSKAVDQRTAEWLRQKYSLDNHRNQVLAQVNRAMTDYQNILRQIEILKKQIIPQAQQTVDSMLAGYQVSKVDFLNLVRSQTKLYNFETDYWKALSGANQALGRLEAAVGGGITHE
ncbi:TolC family protein [Pseudomonadota bacterium]